MPIRIILQRVKHAQLLINGKSFKSDDEQKEEDQWIDCGEGVIIYIAFFKNTNDEEIRSLVNKIFSNPLFRTHRQSSKKHEIESGNETRNETDILIVPQFSLGGKMKSGKAGSQYHQNAKPNVARTYYEMFCQKLIEKNGTIQQNKKQKAKHLNANIHCGIFGNRQGLQIETNGPFTHCFDINIEDKSKKKQNKNDKQQKAKKAINDRKNHKEKQVEDSSKLSNQIDSIIDLIQ
eukprot:179857_1